MSSNTLQGYQEGQRRKNVLVMMARSIQLDAEDGACQEATPSRRGVLGTAACVSGLVATQALFAFDASALTLEDVTPSIAPAPTLSAM